MFARLFNNLGFKKINNLFNILYSLLTLIIEIWEINNFCNRKYEVAMFTKYLKLVDIENHAMLNSLTVFAIHICF